MDPGVSQGLEGPPRSLRGLRRSDGWTRMSHDFRYERLVEAPPGRVFDVLTSPEGQREMYDRDEVGWVVESECELRVGGAWTISFGPSPDVLYHHRHVFDEIDRPRKLRMTTTETRPDGSSFTTSTEFTFEARGEATLMAMSGAGFPTTELRDEHTIGVPHAFDRLERHTRRPKI